MKTAKKDCIKQKLESGMCGFIPLYGKDGTNGTLILMRDKSPQWEKYRLRTLVAQLARLYQKDIFLVRLKARELSGQRTMNPLPISAKIILVPFKVRKPVGKDDGSVGYIFISAIREAATRDKGTVIILNDDQEIPVMDSLSTANRRIRTARHISASRVLYPLYEEKRESVWREMQESYTQPATRGDIAMLSKNILNLMDRLGL